MSTPAAVPPGHAPQPSKLPAWAIVVIIVVILCCFCGGALGLLIAFGDPILQELGLAALLPPAGLL